MRVQIWIREEDLTEWEQIGNKSQWIHDQLSGDYTDLERTIKKVMMDNISLIVEALRGY